MTKFHDPYAYLKNYTWNAVHDGGRGGQKVVKNRPRGLWMAP